MVTGLPPLSPHFPAGCLAGGRTSEGALSVGYGEMDRITSITNSELINGWSYKFSLEFNVKLWTKNHELFEYDTDAGRAFFRARSASRKEVRSGELGAEDVPKPIDLNFFGEPSHSFSQDSNLPTSFYLSIYSSRLGRLILVESAAFSPFFGRNSPLLNDPNRGGNQQLWQQKRGAGNLPIILGYIPNVSQFYPLHSIQLVQASRFNFSLRKRKSIKTMFRKFHPSHE
ncbi:hypothetical protein AMTR_s05407p00004870 [Amborella trichopoda]|uniref:Uncharacterized protein n=1 Tax=Amborella trichopoda TaxID=13333 RepID=U5CTY4_AMBTC|nr:hypothetical protein AMTR_s05407p00004870 [Amborella trichopoda]